MDQKQRAAAYRLLAAIEANEITKEDAMPMVIGTPTCSSICKLMSRSAMNDRELSSAGHINRGDLSAKARL